MSVGSVITEATSKSLKREDSVSFRKSINWPFTMKLEALEPSDKARVLKPGSSKLGKKERLPLITTFNKS